jgi:hypothetical protein
MTPDLLPSNMTSKILVDAQGCWIWIGARTSRGYGSVGVRGRAVSTHRLAYQLLVGPIAEGLQIDHLCLVKACCNPSHLEAVTPRENVRRWTSTITHCPQGHAYDATNTFLKRGSRQCRVCTRGYKRAYEQRRLEAVS